MPPPWLSHQAATVAADLTSREGHTDAGILCLPVPLAGVLLLCLGQEQGEHRIGIHHPDLSDLGTIIASVEVLRVASDFMVDQVCLLLLPCRLHADPVVGGADAAANGALVFYRGAIGQEGIGAAVGVSDRVPQQAGKVDLTGAGIGHRIASVQGVCCLIQGSEGVQVLLLGGGQGGSGHRGGLLLLVL